MKKFIETLKIETTESCFTSEPSINASEESPSKQNASSKEEKDSINKHYIELVSKMRIVANNPKKKLLITDEEYEEEYKKISNLFSRQQKRDSNRKKLDLQLIRSKSIKLPTTLELNNLKSSIDLYTRGKLKECTSRSKVFSPVLTFRRSPQVPSLPISKKNSELSNKEYFKVLSPLYFRKSNPYNF